MRSQCEKKKDAAPGPGSPLEVDEAQCLEAEEAGGGPVTGRVGEGLQARQRTKDV